MMQVLTSDALSWWAGIGGTAGVVAFAGAIYKLGAFAGRVSALERDLQTKASRDTVTGMQDTLDAMRRDIEQIRDILLTGSRR